MDRDAAGSGEMLSLMTLHGAKGLEFEHVFLPGWEEDVFPNKRSISVDEGGTASLEEERRLAYVGLTRAKLQAHVSFAASRRIYNQWLSCVPSRFIDELPERPCRRSHLTKALYGGRPRLSDWAERCGRCRVLGRRKAGARTGLSAAARRTRRHRGGDRYRGACRTGRDAPAASPVGVRVFHQKFGYGTVTASDGGKLEIEFEKAGAKKVMESFVEPA